MPKWPSRSWLISTVENPHYIEKAKHCDADALILELEAGTVDKSRARSAVAHAMRSLREVDKYVAIRINPIDTEDGVEDLRLAVATAPSAIVLTKVTSAEEVKCADELIAKAEAANGLRVGSIELAIMVERARAIFTAIDLPSASPRVKALCFGGGDYTVDIGTRMTIGTGAPVLPGIEILVARSLVVAAARANGISPIDVPHVNVLDDPNFLVHAYTSRAMGFDGVIALSPRQIPLIHQAFTPSQSEIAHATEVVRLYNDAVKKGIGVIGVDGEMISATIVKWYRAVLERAGLAT